MRRTRASRCDGLGLRGDDDDDDATGRERGEAIYRMLIVYTRLS